MSSLFSNIHIDLGATYRHLSKRAAEGAAMLSAGASEGATQLKAHAKEVGVQISRLHVQVTGQERGRYKEHYIKLDEREIKWKKDSEGLYLLCHGLLSHPSALDPVIEKVKASHPGADIVAPFIPEGGNCKLVDAAEPVLALAQQYLKKHPKKKVCLIGHSNGGRIATYVSARLPNDTPVRVCAIAAPFFGAKIVDTLRNFTPLKKVYHPDLLDELSVGSEIATSLMLSMEGQGLSRRCFSFHASKHDCIVDKEISRSLPILGRGSQIFEYIGEGHISVIDAAALNIARNSTDWMKKFKPIA